MAQRLKKWLENRKNALGRAPEHNDVNTKLKPLSATASAGEVTVWLDQFSIVINHIDDLVKETRTGVIVAIAATISTAIAPSQPLFQPPSHLV
jgi:hypothetical protein